MQEVTLTPPLTAPLITRTTGMAMEKISDDDEGDTPTACMHMCVRALTFGCHRIRSLDLGLDRPTWYVVLCYAMLCYAMLCYAMIWYGMCCAMLRYAMLW